MRALSKWMLAALLLPGIAVVATEAIAGAEIYEAQAQRPGSDAGLTVGDVVTRFRAEAGARGRIVGALDLLLVEMQWSDLGSVRLHGRSAGKPRDWQLAGGGWGIKVRPSRSGDERVRLLAALGALEQGATDDGCAQLLALAHDWTPDDRRWAEFRCLDERIRKKQSAAATAMLAQWYPPGQGGTSVDLGLLAVKLAAAAYDVADWALLDTLLAHANAAFAGADARLPSLAALRLGKATNLRGQFADVLEVVEPSAEQLRKLAPGSLRLAALQNELAWAHLNLGQLDDAERLIRSTLAIARERALGAIDLSKYQGHLAIILQTRNDLDGAEREITAALDRLIAVKAGDKFLSPVWNNLGVIRRDRGDYVGAEDAFRQSMEMEERRDPAWVTVAVAYGNMAAIARARGDLATAQRWAERARPILLKAVPDGTEVAQNLHLLGGIALDRGELDAAQAHYEGAIAVWTKIAPGSLRHALTLDQLGLVAQQRGQPEQARGYFEAALRMRATVLPDGLDVGLSWYRIGSLELDSGRLKQAHAALAKAVAIGERLAPQAVAQASALNALGRSEQALGDSAGALAKLCRAADVLDRSRTRFSRDPKEQATAMAQYARIRIDCVLAKVRSGDAIGAFDTLERGRGRALLAQLSRRDLLYADQLPAALRRQWAALEADIARLESRRGAGAPAASSDDELQRLQAERERLIARIRAEAPRFAALQFPEPLDFAAVQRKLDDDTALVALVMDASASYALVVRAGLGAPVVRELPLDAGAAADVAQLRAALAGAAPERAASAAKRWYRRLIAPIAADLGATRRLVLVPDARLYGLPFAALQDAHGRHLIERYSITLADSATLWAGSAAAGKRAGHAGLLAVANGEGGVDPQLGAARGAVAALPALPFARVEVERIGALDPGRSTLITDASATEARVQALARDAGRVHFAVHSLFDPISPLESGLLLRPDANATGAAADGLLQAWEIFDGWRTGADLVTLSGCDTGQGSALADEGLVGLTRAFQFAGAHNVVASLWSVSDRSTAELMTRFYQQLALDLPVDQALQAAQLSMLRETSPGGTPADADAQRGVGGLVAADRERDQPHDWTWAAFQVYGGR